MSQTSQEPALFFEQNLFGFIQKRIVTEQDRFQKLQEQNEQIQKQNEGFFKRFKQVFFGNEAQATALGTARGTNNSTDNGKTHYGR